MKDNVEWASRRGPVSKALVRLIVAAKNRAQKQNVPFALDIEWLFDLAEKQQYRCVLTGIPFDVQYEHTTRANPFTPSLDRLDRSKGYTKDNVRLVNYAINVMLMDWGEDIFASIVEGYYGTKEQQIVPAPKGRVRERGKNPELNQPPVFAMVGEADVAQVCICQRLAARCGDSYAIEGHGLFSLLPAPQP